MLLFIGGLFVLSVSCGQSEEKVESFIKVACVGDSITFGARIGNPREDSYPAQLQLLLGEVYNVKNFGFNGATMLAKGNKPYAKQAPYRKAIAFLPEIVIIKLGTNDSKGVNWKYSENFEKNYKAMISKFKALPSNPEVFLCLPVKSFFKHDDLGEKEKLKKISQENIVMAIAKIKKIAKDDNLTIIDLHSKLTEGKHYDSDQVHPNESGAKLIAETVAKTLKTEWHRK